jgi:hypothetical protein
MFVHAIVLMIDLHYISKIAELCYLKRIGINQQPVYATRWQHGLWIYLVTLSSEIAKNVSTPEVRKKE